MSIPLCYFQEDLVGEARSSSSSSLQRPAVLLMERAAPQPRAEDAGVGSQATYKSVR